MDRRAFFRQAGISLLAATPEPPVAPVSPSVVDAKTQFGAAGNGLTDDTTALQAAINAAVAAGVDLYIPPGIYKTTASLTVGDRGPTNHGGIGIFGGGPGIGGGGGTTIVYYGSRAAAIMQVNRTMWRFCNFENFTLMCNTPRGASYGLLFDSTEYSQHTVRRVNAIGREAIGPSTAFGILAGTGANGEFVLFEDCYAQGVDTFFYSNAGQAYVQHFVHCRSTVNTGGTYFNLDNGGLGGFGIEIWDFNATSTQTDSISNTTFIRTAANSSCLNVFGGRVEHLTRLFLSDGGSPRVSATPLFQGLQCGIDFDPTNAKLSTGITGVIEQGGLTNNLLIQSCQFYADSLNATFPVKIPQGWSDIRFKSCIFQLFDAPPYLSTLPYDEHSQLVFEDCKTDAAYNAANSASRMTNFDRSFETNTATVGKRRPYSTSAVAPSGYPSNLLAQPGISPINGNAVAPVNPWVMSGASKTLIAHDWNGTIPPASPSPWARHVELPPHSTLHQDITSLPLNTTNNFGYYGQAMTLVTFQAFFTRFGMAKGSVAIVDSVSEKMYDRFEIFQNAPGPFSGPVLVTLSAVIERTASLSYPRIKFMNNDESSNLLLEFSWMFVSGQPDAMFTPSDGGPTQFAEMWGLGAESAAFWSRLAIPYKPDAFGSAARKPLADLQSDIYLSTTDQRITFFANGKWWKQPRTVYGTAAPIGGAWAVGDQVLNSTPAAGGNIGWICVEAGTPGIWKSFGAIAN